MSAETLPINITEGEKGAQITLFLNYLFPYNSFQTLASLDNKHLLLHMVSMGQESKTKLTVLFFIMCLIISQNGLWLA